MASKTQTQKKKEDSLLLILPQESEEADSVISIVNYSGNCRNQIGQVSLSAKRIVEQRYHLLFLTIREEGGKGEKGKKRRVPL